VKELRGIGIQPDILLCRCERSIASDMKDKIALFCDVDARAVVTARDVPSVYEVPLVFGEEGVDEMVVRMLKLDGRPRDMSHWSAMLGRMRSPMDEVSIGLVGKYVEYEDSYKSLKEALLHGGLAHQLKVNINWIEAEGVNGPDWDRQLEGYDGILVPGGFGKRGIDGMLNAIRYARENHVPYFGICLGMQTMVIEFARNICGLEQADSTEFNPATPHRVIFKLRELKGIDDLGGTMRLGPAVSLGRGQCGAEGLWHARHQRAAPPSLRIQPGIRGAPHRLRTKHHRPDARPDLRGNLRDSRAPWMLGCQFHPEFKSKPLEPHPLFKAFIGAAYCYRSQRLAPLTRQAEPEYSRGD